MSWNWGKLSFRSAAARKTIEAGLGQDKQEPVFSPDAAASNDEGRAEPTLTASAAPDTLPAFAAAEPIAPEAPVVAASAKPAIPAWDAKPLAFKPAPPLGLRVKAKSADETPVTAAPVIAKTEHLPAPPAEVIVPVEILARGAADDVNPEPAAPAGAVAEVPAEPEEPPVDYLAMGRTLNTFGHAARMPADDERQPMWAEQRVSRGFDDTELWNLEDSISRFALPRLKALRAMPLTPPTGLSLPQWHALLDKMILAFQLLQPAGGGSWDRGKLSNTQRSQLQEGLDHFRNYFFALTC